ncbi:MAG TPA: hypothetical protein VIJ87_04890, partial [Pyrinomonadaceae bacterium]
PAKLPNRSVSTLLSAMIAEAIMSLEKITLYASIRASKNITPPFWRVFRPIRPSQGYVKSLPF